MPQILDGVLSRNIWGRGGSAVGLDSPPLTPSRGASSTFPPAASARSVNSIAVPVAMETELRSLGPPRVLKGVT